MVATFSRKLPQLPDRYDNVALLVRREVWSRLNRAYADADLGISVERGDEWHTLRILPRSPDEPLSLRFQGRAGLTSSSERFEGEAELVVTRRRLLMLVKSGMNSPGLKQRRGELAFVSVDRSDLQPPTVSRTLFGRVKRVDFSGSNEPFVIRVPFVHDFKNFLEAMTPEYVMELGDERAASLSAQKQATQPRMTPPADTPAQQVAPLGSGRQLDSTMSVEECLATLDELLLGYRPRQYKHLPHLIEPGYIWNGPPDHSPTVVVCCQDEDQDFLLVAMWPRGPGAEVGIFPLGSGDDRLQLGIIGHWFMQTHAVHSRGVFPAGVFSLRPPRLREDYLSAILAAAGYPSSARNLEVLADELHRAYLLKAHQFIAGSAAEHTAKAFVDAHRATPSAVAAQGSSLTTPLQMILDDLAGWNTSVLPYIQDMPTRLAAVLLELQGRAGTVLDQLER